MKPASQKKDLKFARPKRLGRGFVQTGGVLSQRIRTASEKRGFAETRLLTAWSEIVGEALSQMAQPVKVSYAKNGFGATLTVLCKGANAPMVQMQTPQLIERVNSCYGYSAISRIRVTQTAAAGFAEGKSSFEHPHKPGKIPLSVEDKTQVKQSVSGVSNDSLRQALEQLGQNILTHKKSEN